MNSEECLKWFKKIRKKNYFNLKFVFLPTNVIKNAVKIVKIIKNWFKNRKKSF
jgi:hypothetical protein